jgi:hypothetical protein
MCGARGSPEIVLWCALVVCSAAAVQAQDLSAWDYGSALLAASERATSDSFMASAGEVRSNARPQDHDYPSYVLEAFSLDPTTWTQSPAGEHLAVDMILSPSTSDNPVGLRRDETHPQSGSLAFDPLESTEVSAVVPVVGAIVLGMVWAGLIGWLHRRSAH